MSYFSSEIHNPLHNQLHSPSAQHMCCDDVTIIVIWLKKNRLIFWRVAVNTFTFLCLYDMRIVLLKWKGQTLMKWLSEKFWRCCLCVYVLIETSRAIQCVCVCVCAKENARLISCIISAYEYCIAGSRSVKEISCTAACHSTAALLQTGTSTSVLNLHRHFLSARYLSGLSFSGEHER